MRDDASSWMTAIDDRPCEVDKIYVVDYVACDEINDDRILITMFDTARNIAGACTKIIRKSLERILLLPSPSFPIVHRADTLQHEDRLIRNDDHQAW